MSRWSASDPERERRRRGGLSPPSAGTLARDRRAQVEPTAALVALFALGVGLSCYAGVVADALPGHDREVAVPTLDRVAEALTSGGIADPRRLDAAARAGPEGYDLNLTLRADGRTWHRGGVPPAGVAGDAADRRLSVRLGPGRVAAGRLRVEVWR